METMKSGYIKWELKDHVAVIYIDHQPVNALNIAMLSDILELYDTVFPQNKEIRCAVITGMGKHFSAGADFNDFYTLPHGCNTPFGIAVFNCIDNSRIPTICAINGTCLGGGMELALSCDIRVASESAKMGLVEASVGIAPNYGGCTRLSWLIGEGNAKYLLMTADRISAAEAQKYGILQEVYLPEEFEAGYMKLANRIASNAPLSNYANKRVINTSRRQILSSGFVEEEWAANFLSHTSDAKEGFKAMKEKRPPKFTNN